MKNLEFIDNLKLIYITQNIRSPLSVSLDLTSKCNLHCTHCYNKNTSNHDVFTSKTVIQSVVDKLKGLGILEVTLCGGEPLVSPFFLDFVRLLKCHGMSIRLITNGSIIENYIVDLETLFDESDVIQVSIDEPQKHTNGQRYSVDFENTDSIKQKVYENLQLMSTRFANIIVNIVPTSINQNDIAEIFCDIYQCGIKHVGITPYIPIGGADMDDIKPDYSFLRQLENDIYAEFDDITYRGGLAGHPCQQTFYSKPDIESKLPQWHTCEGGNTHIHISSDGKIYPCAFFQSVSFQISDINYSLERIKKDFAGFDLLNKIEFPIECVNCERIGECNGGCLGLIYDRYHNLSMRDPRCIL